MGTNNTGREFTTLDAYLAGYLSMHGQAPRLIDQNGKIAFTFDSKPEVTDLLQRFSLGATVVASQYVFQVKSLKSRVHEMRREKGGNNGNRRINP